MFPQSTILGPLFWMIMGALYLFVAYSARIWAKDLKLEMKIQHWILLSVWYLFLNLGVAAAFTFYGENEKMAGNYIFIITLFTTLLSGIILYRYLKKSVQE